MASRRTVPQNSKLTHAQQASKKLSEEGLPNAVAMERLVLGSILLNDSLYDQVAAILAPDDLTLEPHRRILSRMADMHERGERIDRPLLVAELQRQGQLESVGGISAILDLNQDLPELPNVESYCREVKRCSGLRRIIFSARDLANQALLAQDDPDALIETATSKLQEIANESRTQESDGGQTVEELVTNFPGGISAFLDPMTRRLGMPTGIDRFDEMTGGMKGGELIVIAARPGAGKTSLCMNIAEHLVLNKHKYFAFFSLEMSAEAIVTRMLCSIGSVNQMKFRAGFLERDERSRIQMALHQLTEARFRIYDRPGITVREICRTAKKLVEDEGCHAVAIDYLQLCGVSGKSENRNLEIGEMTRQLKLLAQECDIPVILLSQLSRAPEKRGNSLRPILSDLRDGGSIESDADLVVFIFREWLYRRDRDDLRNCAELIIGKNRNGPAGVVPVAFLGEFTKFANKSEEVAPES
jgi:replicative DNA helicase